MHSERELIQAWLMYYWRSLFYTSVPTRKPIEQRACDQENRESYNEVDSANDLLDDRDEETVETNDCSASGLLQGVVDESLAKTFDAYTFNAQKSLVFLVAPIRIRKETNGKIFEYYPFWFPLSAFFNEKADKWEIKCEQRFHDIYVPRKFMSPQAGEDNYAIEFESEDIVLFTTCEKYERYYSITVDWNTPLTQYIGAIKEAFKNMTGVAMEQYACEKPGLTAEFNPFIHIEKPRDFTKKIRRLYSVNLQDEGIEIPKLLQSLILPKHNHTYNPVGLDNNEYSEAGMLHVGQMNNRYPLSPSQRKALLTWLKYKSEEDIMVVNGPPGTGKTTLIQSLIASEIVQSAILGNRPFVALCCASTHKAVTNIIDSFNGNETSNIRLLPKLKGYASYVSWPNDLAKHYFRFPPNASEEFCKGPLFPGDGDSSGVETEDYISFARNAFIAHFEESLSLESIVDILHKEVLYHTDRIKNGINALLRYLCDNNTDEIEDWFRTLRDDVNDGRVFVGKQIITFDANDDKIAEHFQELLDMTYRYSAFVSSIRYWEARWLINPAIENQLPDTNEKKARLIRRKAMLTPCFVTTIHSSVSLFPFINKEEISPLFSLADCLILDEAGQTLPEIGTVAFAFAKKGVVFGDSQQLEPIHGILTKLDIGDLIQSSVPCSKEDICQYENRNMLSSSGNMVGFAQSSCNIVDNMATSCQRGIMLVEHRRCRKEIIDYCNKLVYGGLLYPQTSERENYLYPPFVFVSIDGKSSVPDSNTSKFNEIEADAIVSWIDEQRDRILKEYAGKFTRLEDIVAIVTPFKAQERFLNSRLSSIGIKTVIQKKEENGESLDDGKNEKPMVVGTVHKLQGAQAPIVIFSSVYGSNDSIMRFIDTKPNLLNVAVSRAQDAFIVFGNGTLYHKSALKYYRNILSGRAIRPIPSGLLKVFCNRYDSSAPFLFDSMPDYQIRQYNPVDTCTDGERIIVDLLKEIPLPFYMHIPLSEVYDKLRKKVGNDAFSEEELSFILNTDAHFDFLVSMDKMLLVIEVDGYKHGTHLQCYRDRIKDSITKKLGLRMLRIPTDSSMSKDEIKHRISELILSAITSNYPHNKKSWEITLSMYQEGFPTDEIAAARGMQINTIKQHLAKAVVNRQLDFNDLLSEERLSTIVQSVKRIFRSGMTKGELFHALGDTIEYYEIDIALSCLNEDFS